MNEPYIVKISDSDAMMFGCEADERVREFAAKFNGWEYESEFERTGYLLGTDVFIEAASEGGETFLSLREWDSKGHSRGR